MTLLRIENLSTGYEKDPIIQDISFSIASGTICGIIGPNGAGKTTLFKSISKILKPWKGTIYYREKDITKINRQEFARQLSVIPQFHGMLPPFTVEEFIRLGRYPHTKRFSLLKPKDHEIVAQIMEILDIAKYRTKKITTLSGGEMQRAFLAQGMVQNPAMLLMDEPTSHLDIRHQIKILDLVKALAVDTGLAVMIILHDLNLASAYCDHIALMKNGRIFAQGTPASVLTREGIEEVYGTKVHVRNVPGDSKPHIFFIPGQFS